MPPSTIGQFISIFGMALTVLSFQLKTRKQILLFQTLGSSLWLISYLLLGTWAGCYINGFFLIRNVIFYFRKDKKWAQSIVWLPIMVVASIGVGALGYQTPWDLLPIVGAVVGTFSMYMSNENMLRLLKLGESPCWLVYNCSIPSIGGIICELCSLTSLIVGLIRYRKMGFSSKETKESAEK
ncbi:MAG: YgjV family protein [Ruminococcaceae bacterium]|nr:YgjV family protein [Oscillospiraceae bacterium]